jgi:hypothetical protein
MSYWFIPIIFSAGVLFGAWWASRPDDVCRQCKASYSQEIEGLKKEIHGLKSTKGALSKELQNMSFGRYGAKAR